MNRRLFSILVVALLVGVTGCSAAATPAPPMSRGAVPAQPAAPSQDAESGGARVFGLPPLAETANQPQAANAAGAERMIVYSGQLELVIKDTRAVVEQITQIVKDAGGFVTE